MKLLLENWRKYLNEAEEVEDILGQLNRLRYEDESAASDLTEQREDGYEVRDLPIGQIYCDMDGCLADFTGGVLNLIWKDLKYLKWIKKTKLDAGAVSAVGLVGKLEYELKMLKARLKQEKAGRQDPQGWEEIQKQANEYFERSGDPNWWERLFADLPVLPAGEALWGLIGPLGVTLLTGAPAGGGRWFLGSKEGVYNAKVRWAQTHLSPPPKSIIKQSDKSPYAMDDSLPNLLIDDWDHNIEGWRKAGGCAVKFDETGSAGNLEAVGAVLESGCENETPT